MDEVAPRGTTLKVLVRISCQFSVLMIKPQVSIHPTICVTTTKLTAAAHDKNTCSVDTEKPQANCHSLELIVDTGPFITILADTMYKHDFADSPFKEATKLLAYG